MQYSVYIETARQYQLLEDNALAAFEESGHWTKAGVMNLPVVLCGPILRRVEPEAVSVWLLLSTPITSLELSVYADDNGKKSGTALLTGTACPVPLGAHFHFCVITAKPVGNNKLEYGKSYLYDIEFGLLGGFTAPNVLGETVVITYPGYELPALMLPPNDLSKLHIVHGSCRGLDCAGEDAFVALDTLMAESWNTNRPQQLFLNGDQVYADEGNVLTEHLITAAGNALLAGMSDTDQPNWVEKIKDKDKDGKDKKEEAALLWPPPEPGPEPGTRGGGKDYQETHSYIHYKCGFTAASNYHLFTLAEFFAHYVHVWSDTLWPGFYKDKNILDKGKTIQDTLISQIKDENRIKNFDPEAATAGDQKGFWIYIFNLLCAHWEAINSYRKLCDPEAEDLPETEIRTIIENIKLPANIYESISIDLLENLQKQLFKQAKKNKTQNKGELLAAAYEIEKIIKKMRLPVAILIRMNFTQGLPRVRRILANISTYMMFDDHEVTDDWHMTREWVHRAYSKPMGRRVMQNALTAFALFQAWGNTPKKFEEEQPGGVLLDALKTWIESKCTDTDTEKLIANVLKIPFGDDQVAKFQQIKKGEGLPEIFNKPLSWHYRLDHPAYEVIALDARTFRSFPGSLYRPAEHLSRKAIDAQIPAATAPRELTVVISPCNVVTIPLFRNFLSAVGLPIYQIFFNMEENRFKMPAYDPDMADSWEIGSPIFEYLIKKLAARAFKLQTENARRSRVLILSGDVHFSWAGRMAYWADENSANDKKEMTIACLTSSGMKNEAGAWEKLKLDEMGYEYVDIGTGSQQLPEPEIMIGYTTPPADMDKAKKDEITLRTRWFPNYYPYSMLEKPLVLPYHKLHPDVKVPKPEWFYRIDFLRGERAAIIPEINETVNMNHLLYARDQRPSTEIIRHNNFAALSFDWSGEGTLTKDIGKADKSFTLLLKIGKPFPPPPFYALIEDEIVYVLKTSSAGSAVEGEVKFEQVRRGRGNTEARAHSKNKTVRIRQSVNQLHWINHRAEQEAIGTPLKLTRFKVSLESDDPQFAKPSPNTL